MPFQIGHPGFKKKGTKHRETLLKEERRAIFDKEVSQVFEEKIKQARPEYLLDQFLGPAPQEHKITIEQKPLSEEKVKAIDDIMLNDK